MRRYITYFVYVVTHKCYVFKECRKLGLSFRQSLLHDISKFLPSEFFAYARRFYNPDDSKSTTKTIEFKKACELHKSRNAHHWEFWATIETDTAKSVPIEMPIIYIKEMVADWIGMAKGDLTETKKWYLANQSAILLHPQTRIKVMEFLQGHSFVYRAIDLQDKHG